MSISAKFLADFESFKASVQSAEGSLKSMEGASTKLGTTFDSVKGIATSMAGAFGIAFSVGALKAWVSGVLEAASQIDDLSKKIGVSTDAVQRWKHAAEQSGATIADVSTAVAFMNKTLAGGDASTVAALQAAGLQFGAIRAMAPETAFNAIATAIGTIEDPMIRAQVAVELFGRGGQTLLPAIVEGFVKTGQAADVMSKETIARLDAAGDAWTKLGNKATIISGEMIAALLKTFDQPPNEQAYADAFFKPLHLDVTAAIADLKDLKSLMDIIAGEPIHYRPQPPH